MASTTFNFKDVDFSQLTTQPVEWKPIERNNPQGPQYGSMSAAYNARKFFVFELAPARSKMLYTPKKKPQAGGYPGGGGGYPPQQGYGYPPPQQGYGYPPQQGYGGGYPPPQQGYGGGNEEKKDRPSLIVPLEGDNLAFMNRLQDWYYATAEANREAMGFNIPAKADSKMQTFGRALVSYELDTKTKRPLPGAEPCSFFPIEPWTKVYAPNGVEIEGEQRTTVLKGSFDFIPLIRITHFYVKAGGAEFSLQMHETEITVMNWQNRQAKQTQTATLIKQLAANPEMMSQFETALAEARADGAKQKGALGEAVMANDREKKEKKDGPMSAPPTGLGDLMANLAVSNGLPPGPSSQGPQGMGYPQPFGGPGGPHAGRPQQPTPQTPQPQAWQGQPPHQAPPAQTPQPQGWQGQPQPAMPYHAQGNYYPSQPQPGQPTHWDPNNFQTPV